MERNVPNDFVSRYELVKHLVGVHDGWRHPFGYTVEDEIINFPAADVEPVRHGRWEIRNWGFDYYCCSACGFEHRYEGPLAYCPSCGAKMDGGKENDLPRFFRK